MVATIEPGILGREARIYQKTSLGLIMSWIEGCCEVALVSKVPNYRVFLASIIGTVIMVLGRYLIIGYMDP